MCLPSDHVPSLHACQHGGMIEITESRGWSSLKVRGGLRFRGKHLQSKLARVIPGNVLYSQITVFC